jgi:phage terminase large subunit-like protein
MTSLLESPPVAPPRVRSVPAYTFTLGPEAVELAAVSGLILDPWQEAAVDDVLAEGPNGKWAAFEAALLVPRQNGKGAILEAVELADLFLFGAGLILHTAHEFKTAQEAFRRILFLVDNTHMLRRKVDRVRTSHGEEGIELTRAAGGGRLRFLARSGGSGRGFSADRVIYDEAYELPEETVAASLPTMSARPNPGVIYTSSAALDKSVVLRRVMARGRREDDRKQDPGLCYLEHSADPKADLDDRAEWARANPAMAVGRIREEFIAKERAAMSEVTFARERLGIVDESRSATVIDMSAWDDAADLASLPERPVAFAIDTSPDGSFTSIAVAGRNAAGRIHVEVVERRRGTGWVPDRVEELRDAWQPTSIVCDPIGPVGALLPAFAVAGVDVTTLGMQEHVQACGLFKQLVEAPLERYAGSPGLVGVKRLAHHAQIGLRAALESARKRNVGEAGGWLWNRRDETDISPLVAASLAVFAHSRDVPEPVSEAIVFGWR